MTSASHADYRTAPVPSSDLPPGIPYIVGNEAAERFSYYGMRTILVVFMTKHLLGASGDLDVMTDTEAKYWYHQFSSAVYLTPLFGALLADVWLGKYRTIIGLSIVYCLGHLALALDETRLGLAIGLGLISLGSGGIKPCVSAHVGDQFGKSNAHLLEKVFGWFYFAINLGAFVSTLLTPWLLERAGPHVAFGIPGVLMLIATWVFWLGRHRFVHIPPGGKEFVHELRSPRGVSAFARLAVLYVFIAMFWALYDQSGSAWVLQAEHMNLNLFGFDILPAQAQAANPILILAFIPLFSNVVYPAVGRVMALTPLRKIGCGLFGTALAFLFTAQIEVWIQRGDAPSIAWQFVAYVILTASEVLVSITSLEFAYTQAPTKLKSIVMSLYLVSVSLGNQFTAMVNWFIENPDGTVRLTGPSYYLFFTATMLVTAVLFVPFAMRFREERYIQDEARA